MVSGTIRWKGYLDSVITRYTRKRVKGDVRYLLWLTLYQILFMKKAAYHVVKEAVEFAKRNRGSQVAGFVNLILRRVLSEGHNPFIEGREHTYSMESLNLSFPPWLLKRWSKRFGTEEVVELLNALNRPPEFALRINTAMITKAEAKSCLEGYGLKVRDGEYSEAALYVDRLMPLFEDPLFKNGAITIQDEASQLAGIAVDAKRGDAVLDACAGIGTKTLHLNGIYKDIVLYAMDIDIKRLGSAPYGVGVYKVNADGLASPFKAESFDKVLLDAPCTSLGIIRKHPEIKWRRAEADIENYSRYQLSLLEALWEKLKRGGYLIYSVCSFEPEETVDVLERFSRRAPFTLENPFPLISNKEYLISIPHKTGMDGFFIARLRKG